MFKCEVVDIRHFNAIQETQVVYRVGDKGSNKTINHPITGKTGNRSFIIGETDKSIKTGDLLRCDGLPFMTKPKSRIINVKDSNGRVMYVKSKELPHGYKPFQLDSGFWVLRRK